MVVKYRIRLYIITLMVLAGFAALAQRLWHLTIERYDEFKGKVRVAKILRARIPGARGEIKDRNGITLVANKPSFEVRINLKMLVDEYRRRVEEDNRHIKDENRKIIAQNKEITDELQKIPLKEYRKTPLIEFQYFDKGFPRTKDEVDIVTIVNESVVEPLNAVGLASPFRADKLRIQYRTTHGVVPWVYRQDLSFEEFSQFAEHGLGLPGVNVTVRPVRQYLYDALACHVLGYVNQADEQRVPAEEKKEWDFYVPDDYGVYGVEKSFDKLLRGRPGSQKMLEDERGRIVSMLEREEPRRGNDVSLTIDARVQFIAERALRESIPQLGRCAAVVIQPSTGEIIAMASVPSFNPNKFIPSITVADFDGYNKNPANPLFNRAVKPFAPGSTYKVAVSFAGILAGTEKEHFNCSGGVTYGNKYMHCWIGKQGGAHGTLGLSDGLKNSCNCFFFQYGNRAGIGNIEKAGHMFGLGEKTGVELSDEEAGILPTPKWLKIHSPKENWSAAYTANVSIGQGLVLATPLQMACVTAAVGNGGTCFVPHLKKLVMDHDELVEDVKPVVRGNFSDYGMTDQKLELVRRGMWKVVNEDGGTGKNARIAGVEVAGKTGTAEAWTPTGSKENHTLFICFAPYKDPKYAICIFLQNGESGGGCSAPIARRIMDQALSLDKGYTVPITALKEVNGHFNKISSVTYEGVAPVALKPSEVDNDTGTGEDIATAPKAQNIPTARAVPAPTLRDAPDAEGSRAVKNQAPPPRRAATFETAPVRSAPAPRPPGR